LISSNFLFCSKIRSTAVVGYLICIICYSIKNEELGTYIRIDLSTIQLLEHTQQAIKNGKSRKTGNKTKKNKTNTQHNRC
jgi:hypothetical protein